MVTANRGHLVRRAVRCYQQQTYPRKELVVVDDGEEDLSGILSVLPEEEVRYIKLERHPDNVLGALRNRALDEARGDYLVQWDDDDWYHPERIARQVAVLEQGFDACTLSGSLMHLDDPVFYCHPYVGYLPDGIPGSIMHRRNEHIRYPEMRRAEDTVYLKAWIEQGRYTRLPRTEVYLFIRCFHGANTWEKKHFLTRMRNTPVDTLRFLWYRYLRGNLFLHPRFQLSPEARAAFQQYLRESVELGLLAPREC